MALLDRYEYFDGRMPADSAGQKPQGEKDRFLAEIRVKRRNPSDTFVSYGL